MSGQKVGRQRRVLKTVTKLSQVQPLFVAALDAVIQFSSFKNTSRHIRIYHLSRSANGAESRLAKKVVKIRPRAHLYTHPPDAVSKSSSAIILKMLRQAFRLRQRSILQQVHFPSTYNTRTFQITTRKTYHSASDHKVVPSLQRISRWQGQQYSIRDGGDEIRDEVGDSSDEIRDGTSRSADQHDRHGDEKPQ
jgi:hypothetical protein